MANFFKEITIARTLFSKIIVITIGLLLIVVFGIYKIGVNQEVKKPEIKGPPDFIENTENALKVILEFSDEYYQSVASNIKIIKPGRRSQINVYTKAVSISSHDIEAPPAWYAAILVHEAMHGKLYKDARWRNKIPFLGRGTPWSGRQAEIECLDRQADALIAFGYNYMIAERIRHTWKKNEYWIPFYLNKQQL